MSVTTAALVSIAVYGVLFVFSTGLVVDGTRHYLLFDDAMISMSYARTLVETGEWVWYPGADRVQGYTNPLWTLLMAAVHLLPLPPTRISGVMQLIGVALVPATAWLCGRTWALARGEPGVAWPPVVVVGLYLPFYIWAGLGLESGLLTLLVAAGLYFVAAGAVTGRVSALAFALLVVGAWTRLDFLPLAAVLWASLLWIVWRAREGLGRFAIGTAAFAACVAALLLFQLAYYGEMVPNTAALKLGVPLETRIERGLDSTFAFLRNHGWLLVPAVVGVLLTDRSLSGPLRGCAVALVATAVGYNLFVGGDAWEWGANANRFLLPVLPCLALGACSIAERLARGRSGAGGRAVRVAAVGLLVLGLNAGDFLSPDRGFRSLRQLALQEPVLTRPDHDLAMLKAGLLLDGAVVQRPIRVALSSAGIVPYLLRDCRFIDILGKSDRVVARQTPQQTAFLPGHVKWDLDRVMAQRPDVLVGNWGGVIERFAEPLVVLRGFENLYVRKDVLDTHFVAVPELRKLYRRLDYGAGS